MYQRLNMSTEKALAYRVTQGLSGKEVKELVEELQGVIDAEGRVRVLLELKAFPYADLKALWEDLKFEMRFGGKIERLALVGEEDVTKWSHRLFAELVGTTTHFFIHDEVDEAWRWLTEERIGH